MKRFEICQLRPTPEAVVYVHYDADYFEWEDGTVLFYREQEPKDQLIGVFNQVIAISEMEGKDDEWQ